MATDAAVRAHNPDMKAALAKSASQVSFNDRAVQYRDTPQCVDVADRNRT